MLKTTFTLLRGTKITIDHLGCNQVTATKLKQTSYIIQKHPLFAIGQTFGMGCEKTRSMRVKDN